MLMSKTKRVYVADRGSLYFADIDEDIAENFDLDAKHCEEGRIRAIHCPPDNEDEPVTVTCSHCGRLEPSGRWMQTHRDEYDPRPALQIRDRKKVTLIRTSFARWMTKAAQMRIRGKWKIHE
jgi:hypothetical protein